MERDRMTGAERVSWVALGVVTAAVAIATTYGAHEMWEEAHIPTYEHSQLINSRIAYSPKTSQEIGAGVVGAIGVVPVAMWGGAIVLRRREIEANRRNDQALAAMRSEQR